MTKLSKQKVAGLWLLIAPTVIIIVALLIAAVVNWTGVGTHTTTTCDSSATATDSSGITRSYDSVCATDLFGKQSTATTAVNVVLYVIGILAGIAWLPGIIIGIILLATSRK